MIASSTQLVTGGASFIGSHIVGALLEQGAAEVRVLDDLSLGTAANLEPYRADPRLRMIRGDVLRSDDLLSAVEGADGVFHTAGIITRPLAEHPERGLDVNVRGTSAVLAAARLAGVRKLVLSSSVSVYGAATGAQIAEDEPFHHAGFGWEASLYGGSKLLAESLCRRYRERHGLDYVALRYPTVYGARQHDRGVNTRFLAEAWEAIRQGRPPVLAGGGLRARDYVYVTDVAAANLRAMEAPVGGDAFNVASGVSTTEAEAVRVLLELAGSGLEPVQGERDTDGPSITQASELSYSVDKAAARLDWRPRVPVAEGLRRLAESLERELEEHSWATTS